MHPFFIYDIFVVVEFCLFSWFFYLIIFNKKLKKVIPVIIVFFVIFSLFCLIFLPESTSFSSITAGVEAVLIISMCIYYFFDQLKQPNTLMIYSSIYFWIIISFLTYLSGTFFLNIYADSMISSKAFKIQYVIINSSFVILKAILLAVAMLMKPNKNNNQTIFPEDRLTDWNISHPDNFRQKT